MEVDCVKEFRIVVLCGILIGKNFGTKKIMFIRKSKKNNSSANTNRRLYEFEIWLKVKKMF